MALPSSSSTAALGGMDPTASMGAPPAALGDPASGSGNTVEVTICSTPDGSYMVYAGSPPDSDGGGDGDMSEDDAARKRAEIHIRRTLDNHGPDLAGVAFVLWNSEGGSTAGMALNPGNRIPSILVPDFVRNRLLALSMPEPEPAG